MEKFIPLSVPNFIGNEKKYVLDAVETEWVSTGGEYINRFEKEIAKYLNTKSAVACQSGTAGLHLALIASEICNENEVIVPTLTFIATVNPVKYVGAEPIFMDCDDSLTIDCKKLERFCETECNFTEGKLINKKSGKHIKAIIVVHIFGNMANMEKIMRIANKYNLIVIEDATEALGSKYINGKYNGKHAGSIGDFGVYSFNGNKIITSGGGGMVISNDEILLEKIKYLSTQAKDDSLNYIHNEIGYNYRMTNVQAAIGLAQLECLEKFITVKEKNYKKYVELIKKINGLSMITYREDIRPNYWFYGMNIDKDKFKFDRKKVLEYLNEKGIQTRPIWGLIHEQKPYRNNMTFEIDKAIKYRECILNVPCSSNLSEEEIARVIKTLDEMK